MGRAVAPEKRAWAMGLATAAGSFGQVVLVPAAGFLIGATDWRTSMVALGICCLSFALLALVLGAKPEEEAEVGSRQSFGQALSEARRHSSYWLLVTGFFVCGFHVTFVFVHMEPWVRDLGFDPSVAYWSIMLIGAFNVVGAYGAGVLGGRRSKKNLLTAIYASRAVLFAAMILIPPTPLLIYLYSAALGILWLSTVPLTSALVGVFFGPRYLATLFGFAFFSHQVGAFLGAQLGGVIRKEFGSYDAMWWMMVALGLVAALLHWPIRERPVDRLMAGARA
jgi:predicted MFS family arabinose efflux permease